MEEGYQPYEEWNITTDCDQVRISSERFNTRGHDIVRIDDETFTGNEPVDTAILSHSFKVVYIPDYEYIADEDKKSRFKLDWKCLTTGTAM